MHTSKLLIGLTLAASIANAQGTKKKSVTVAQNTVPAQTTVAQSDASASNANSTISPATQTSVATADATKPATASKWGGILAYEGAAGVGDIKADGSRALVDADVFAGITYKATDKIKLGLRQYFATPTIGDSAQIDKSMAKGSSAPFKLMDPTAHMNISTDLSVAGSKPLSIANRYYIPVSEASTNAKSLGTIRSQTSIAWDLNPRVTLSLDPQVRLSLNSAEAASSDSVLRLIPGGTATYNFSDAFNAYYFPYADLKMTGHNRGSLAKADVQNQIWQEVGLNVIVANVTINPAWTTSADAKGSDEYEGMGADANSYYLLNVIADF